jgi:fructose-1,6-bisphosphatase/inositol monophosphatase family enzyme
MKELLIEAADAVSNAIKQLEISKAGDKVGMGADGTPTQRIDRIAEDAVLKVLEKNGNPLNVLSEEHEFIDNGAEYTLVLDPIDGTFNAVNGVPFFATSLAVGKERLSGVQWALVKDLTKGTVYFAEKGKGAFADSKRLRTREFGKSTAFSVYMGALSEDESFRIARLARRARNFGAASLELCLVAQGSLDLYYLHTKAQAKLRVVDIAAGTLIVREAGGEVFDVDGNILDVDLNIKTRTDIMAVGDMKVLEVIK